MNCAIVFLNKSLFGNRYKKVRIIKKKLSQLISNSTRSGTLQIHTRILTKSFKTDRSVKLHWFGLTITQLIQN